MNKLNWRGRLVPFALSKAGMVTVSLQRLIVNSAEFCHKYYNQNDIRNVIQVLYASEKHRPLYSGICMAMLQYWNISKNSSHLCVPNGTHLNSESSKIDENDHKGSNMSCPNPDNKSTAAISSKCSLVSNRFINYGNANGTSLPLPTYGHQTGFGKCKGNITSDAINLNQQNTPT
ncbi:hypothetical protein MTR_2g084660 [Medicago truncatula]|uniref:Uncharacterized protein n=1 Tax=Medicago truncatula TaxID=3880 RepID=A0A072VBG5_MEDTR|nr:hypothetical protein MTR_2g084660 [Medicago truncatula]